MNVIFTFKQQKKKSKAKLNNIANRIPKAQSKIVDSNVIAIGTYVSKELSGKDFIAVAFCVDTTSQMSDVDKLAEIFKMVHAIENTSLCISSIYDKVDNPELFRLALRKSLNAL